MDKPLEKQDWRTPLQIVSGTGKLPAGLWQGAGTATPAVIAAGEHDTDPSWLTGLLGYVGAWPQPVNLCLFAQEPNERRCPAVSIRLQDGCVQGVLIVDPGQSPRQAAGQLGALDACAHFACSCEGGDEPTGERFRYAVVAAGRGEKAFEWKVASFIMSLVSLCDVLRDEAPQLAGMGMDTMRRYCINEDLRGFQSDANTSEENELFECVAGQIAADGQGVDARRAAELTGASERTTAALLARMWRVGRLSRLNRETRVIPGAIKF